MDLTADSDTNAGTDMTSSPPTNEAHDKTLQTGNHRTHTHDKESTGKNTDPKLGVAQMYKKICVKKRGGDIIYFIQGKPFSYTVLP